MDEVISISYLKSPFGELILGSHQEEICLCDWRYRKMRAAIDNRIQRGLESPFSLQTSDTIEALKEELADYFDEKRRVFSTPLKLIGSDFQKSVWNALSEIPFGETTTYLKLSEKLGNAKAIRAVATANGANAISILIPCHRVIGSDGSLVGYAGGMMAKRKLLEHEGALKQQRLNL